MISHNHCCKLELTYDTNKTLPDKILKEKIPKCLSLAMFK